MRIRFQNVDTDYIGVRMHCIRQENPIQINIGAFPLHLLFFAYSHEVERQ